MEKPEAHEANNSLPNSAAGGVVVSDARPAVSIIMASFNSAKWIGETLKCVQAQTFTNWELLITDDCSDDGSLQIIKDAQLCDSRIRLFEFDVNKGAGMARNNSLAHAQGRYIAYLDSDDLWAETKLERQIKYMKEKNIAMCYTDYVIISEDGTPMKTIYVPTMVTYDSFLKKPITATHTIAFDTEVVDKKLLIMPDIRRGQDAATWLQVLKTGINGYALHESLAKYRRHTDSLSSNKLRAIKRTWYLYRKIEHLSLPYACVCFISYAVNAVKKYS